MGRPDLIAAVATPGPSARSLRERVVGADVRVPILGGVEAAFVGLDNAASTPPLREVMGAIERFLPYYGGVHRGSGFKAEVSTALFEWARCTVAAFVGADPEHDTVIFGKNTTEAINKLAHRIAWRPDAVVLTTQLEHHSNDLPFRCHAQVVHVAAEPDGRLDEADFERQLARYGGRVQLVAVTGAANVTGVVPPIHRLARAAHRVGAPILVDAAQLAAHRRIDVRPADDPEHLDFVALTAHKMYAPFGAGALVGPRSVFAIGEPEHRGGGTIEIVTEDEVVWADAPARDEAGSPNVVGAIAMAVAMCTLDRIGFEAIIEHERDLVDYALVRLGRIPGVRVHGPSGSRDRVGIVAFDVEGIPHGLVAAVLAHEGGVAVRSGCFCAQPYVARLLGIDGAAWRDRIRGGEAPGLVRMSFGLHNTRAEIEFATDWIERVAEGAWAGRYLRDAATGAFRPDDAGALAIEQIVRFVIASPRASRYNPLA